MTGLFRRIGQLGAAVLVCAVAAPRLTAGSEPNDPDWRLCAEAIPAQEHEHEIPTHLLRAISLAESGRWREDLKRNETWPWTVMAQGRGRFFDTKEEAINEVLRLQARGVSNIDVGCMQVNLHYHGKAFEDLDDAFDPAANARYAGSFLRSLKNSHASWSRAVGYYHSGTPEPNYRYRRKVMQIWRDEKRRALLEPPKPIIPAQTPRQVRAITRAITPEERAERDRVIREQVKAGAETRLEAAAARHQRLVQRFRAAAERQRRVMRVYRDYLIARAKGQRREAAAN